MGWTGERRGVVVEAYYENSRSVIATQRAFRTRFVLGRNASVPVRKTILLGISNLQATGSTLKRNSPGRPRTVRTPENEEGGATVTVTSDRYAPNWTMWIQKMWFQQDGATAHTARRSLRVLREMFPGRLISLRGDVEWPARSPDLSPCDFFLPGYLKEKVFKHRSRSLEDLKERIQQEIDSIPPELTRRVMKNFRERLQQCVANDGRLMSDLIFKTH